MHEFPTGTVTFLFTDIEGSTRLWESHPEAAQEAVARHLALLGEAIASHGGVHFKTIGDAVQAAFPTAAAGLAAALAAQQAMIGEPWPDSPGPLRVRMALHAGTAAPVDGDYLAPSLNRVSRLLAASHGGQVVLTDTIRRLLDAALPPGAELRDLGEHRLRDLLEPERVWQVLAPGLPVDFPPLRSVATRPHNLPAPPTALIGRESELASVLRLFREDARLVTLTGPGGTGKTRLALEAAAELLDDFPDGVWFLDLAGLTDPALLLPQIAAVLGVRESGEQPMADRLANHIAGQRVFLVLDNLEQFRPQEELGRVVSRLLTAAPLLGVLVTSRAPLRLRFERELPLTPLPVPAARDTSVEVLAKSPSVRLFVARAQAVRPGFTLSPQNAAAVAEICRRLDGLPLALELAAARVRALAPAYILSRLANRLDLLVDSGADRPDRQRTLELTVAWSYDLLDRAPQAAFRRLSICAGGFTLEMAEAVLGAFAEPPLDALDAVTTLVEQGLVRDEEQPDGALRFRMLATVRVFGLGRLTEAGEEDQARQAHAAHVRELATRVTPEVDDHWDETVWLDRLEVEHDNLRAALDGMLAANDPAALALAVTLWYFWWPRGYWTEARTWIERVLANDTGAATIERAAALRELGLILDGMGDRQGGFALVEESLRRSQELQDRRGEWETLLDLSLLWAARDYGEAGRYAERALAVARELGDPHNIARSLNRLGNFQLNCEEPQEAFARHREALDILQGLGDQQGVAETLDLLGMASLLGADIAAGMGWYARAVQNWRTLGDPRGLAASLQGSTFGGHNLHTLTVAAPLPTDEVRAAGEESLTLTREIGWRAGEAFVLWSYHGMALGAAGDYAMALPGARQSLDIAREIEHQQWITGAHFTLGVLHAELCDWATARQELTSALDLAQELESLYWIRSAAGWLVSVLTQNGELDAATAVLDAHLDQSTKIDSIAIRILWAAMADLALARGDAERALQTADRLVETAPGSARSPIPRLELLRGQALTALGRYGEGEQALDDALDAATWAGARPLLWRIHAARARLDAAQGKTEAADQALEAAQSVVAELAASVPDDALRAIFLERALAGVTLPSG